MNDWIPKDMSEAAMWSLLAGFFLPVLLNFIVKASWSARTKSLVAFAASVVVGAITALVTGAYEGLGIPTAILLTLVTAVTVYQQWWKQIGVTNRGAAVKPEAVESPVTPTGDGR